MGILDALKPGSLKSAKSLRHNGKRVAEMLEAHQRFVRGDQAGARADLSGADLARADFAGMNLAYVNFRGANLEGASFRDAKLSSADFEKARLCSGDLRRADLTESNLGGADLSDAQVGGAELFRANLRDAILRGADFGATNFRDADVHGADFRGANMKTAILRETDLDGANLSGVDLSTALCRADTNQPDAIVAEKVSQNAPWVSVEDYRFPGGWVRTDHKDPRARAYLEQLERGQILFFAHPPFELPEVDRAYLLGQRWAELRLHKNVSYRPAEDILRGVSGEAATTERLHSILRNYASRVLNFAAEFLAPYAGKWTVDFASFRPFEEEGRGLPLHKRNDLLHVDAFPSRPTHGGRILRIFTNLNPTKPRVWNTMNNFEELARRHAEAAGLIRFAENSVGQKLQDLGRKLGLRGMGRTAYDMFMLRFHDYLKENVEFQAKCETNHLEFPPLATWLVYTDGVAHAALSGQYALEQTLLVSPEALVAPQHAPYRILEKIAHQSLVS